MKEKIKAAAKTGVNLGKIRIHISAIVLIALFFIGGNARVFSALIVAALIHELGHFAAIKAYGLKIKSVSITAVGAAMESMGFSNYKKDIMIAIAGPAASFLTFSFSYALYTNMGYVAADSFVSIFCGLSFVLCVLNLIPVLPLDGGVVLKSYLMLKYDMEYAKQLIFYVSLVTAIILFGLGCVCFYHTRFNISIMLISLFLIFRVSQYEKIM